MISDIPENPDQRLILDRKAFGSALLLAPILFTLLTFWMLLIPFIALTIGALPYLLFATPIFLYLSSHYPIRASTFAIGGLLAHAAFVTLLALLVSIRPDDPPSVLAVVAFGGIPFAAGWGAMFAWCYRAFYRLPEA
jgi:hypothetical protein